MSAPNYVGSPGTRGNTAFSTNITVTTTSAVPVGHTVVLFIGHSSQSTITTFTVAGSAGNTWINDRDIDITSSRGVSVWSARVTTAMPSGSTVTATLASGLSGEKLVACLIELDQYVVADASGVDQCTNTGTSLAAPVTPVTAGTILVAGIVGVSTTAITAGSGMTAGPQAASAAGSPNYQMFTMFKQLSTTSATTAPASWSGGTVMAESAVAYKPATPPPPSNVWRLEADGLWHRVTVWQLQPNGTWI